MGHPKADIVTLSHQHPHHANAAAIAGTPRVLSGPGEYEIADFYITGMGTRRTVSEEDRLANTVFTMMVEGLILCHTGDLAEPLSPRQVDQLRHTDILVAPVGGVCTLSPTQVSELINLISPRIVIPVHFRSEGATANLEPLQVFLRHMGIDETGAQPRLTVTAKSLPAELQVTVLERISTLA